MLRVEAHEPPLLLDMRSVAGPFPMHVTYRFEPAAGGRPRRSGSGVDGSVRWTR
ncbi:hypothetical protein SUDANB95_01022 [Actinosynnema sp. ALI-1.44]